MQTRSSTWEMLALTGDFYLEAKAIIGETEYTAITAPVIDRALFQGSPTVGNCVAASMSVSIRTTDVFPKGAEVQIKMRLWNETRTVSTEWLPAGTFYIQKRQTDYSTGLVTLTCYDAMLKGAEMFCQNDPQVDLTGWPLPMSDVVDYIADRMGVDVDPRTTLLTGDAYEITATPSGQLNEALGHIGACMGGNWCITPEGKLRLVPLQNVPSSPAEDTRAKLVTEMGTVYPRFAAVDSNNVEHYGEWALENGELVLTNDDPDPITDMEVRAILSRLGTSKNLTITGVTMTDDINSVSYTAGTDTGYVLAITGNPYASQAICTALYTALNGLEYHPFDAESTIYDPAAELGDAVYYRDIFRGRLMSEKATLGLAFHGNIGAPASQEVEDEYPYKTPAQKVLEKSAAMADDARKEAVNYLSRDDSGIMVAPMTDDNRYTPSNVPTGVKNTFIDNDSFDIRDGRTVLASFGETSQIGKETENHQVIDSSGIRGVNKDGRDVFAIKMNGGEEHTPWIVDFAMGMNLWTENTEESPYDEPQTTDSMLLGLSSLKITPNSEMHFRFFNAFTNRENPEQEEVNCTIIQGDETPQTVSTPRVQYTAHYDAANNAIAIEVSLIDTTEEITYEDFFVAYIGTRTDIPTFTVQLPAPAYSLGTRTGSVPGAFSTACGEMLSTESRDQFACGKFNADDPDYAFMVGNGDETNGDSNAFAVTWDGNQLMGIDEEATTGTDAALYGALTGLGWESVINDGMIGFKQLLAKLLKRITPRLISNTKLTAPATKLEYAAISVDLSEYSTILVRAAANNVTQLLTFTRPYAANQGIIDYYNAMYFRGLVVVDWELNSVSVAYADCPSGKNNLIWIWQIYAIG